MLCDPIGLLCMPADSGTASGDDGPTPESSPDSTMDAGARSDADAALANDGLVQCSGFDCRCATTSDCPKSFACVDKRAVTADIWNACIDAGVGSGAGWDGGGWGVCMEPCCKSSDCDTGDGGAGDYVCFATGAGGNYCVPPGWLGDRSTIGTNAGGGACGGDAGACRSGLCLSGSSVCADTCCSTRSQTIDCAGNAACRFLPFPGSGFDTHETAQCAAAPPGAGMGRCMGNQECQSNLCVGFVDGGFMMGGMQGNCQTACRSSIDCTGMMRQSTQTCSYAQPILPRTEIVATCAPLFGQGFGDGGAGDGSQCRFSSDCTRGSCVQGVCITVCFADSDCPANERCRPQPVQVGGTTYSVLACGI
jgi:hypothetical protein